MSRQYHDQGELITAPRGTTLEGAKSHPHGHKVEKLPIVDGQGKLRGSLPSRTFRKSKIFLRPNRTATAACASELPSAVSGADVVDRAKILVTSGVDALVVDTAHAMPGPSSKPCAACAALSRLPLVGGNIATGCAAEALIEAGADGVLGRRRSRFRSARRVLSPVSEFLSCRRLKRGPRRPRKGQEGHCRRRNPFFRRTSRRLLPPERNG